MAEVEAVYQGGVFKPLQSVALPENQHVRLTIHHMDPGDVRGWLAAVQERQHRIQMERGFFPDSSGEIAEDRRR
jgi:predicted DNA-binding antitoxin AbrB/MazE fold protein